MAHQLLDAFGNRGFLEISRLLQQGEVERPADDGGDSQQTSTPVAEPLQVVCDEVTDTLRQWEPGRVLERRASPQGAHRLDDDERVSEARRPDLLLEARESR